MLHAVIIGAFLVKFSLSLSAATKSRTVSFPLTRGYSDKSATDGLQDAFRELVESTDFFVQSKDNCDVCFVPLFGKTKVTFRYNEKKKPPSSRLSYDATIPPPPSEFLLKVTGDASKNDFGWICAKFFEFQSMLDEFACTKQLETVVLNHFSKQMLNTTGYDAADARLAGSQEIADLFETDSVLEKLEQNGYVVIDKPGNKELRILAKSDRLLSELLTKKSSQGDDIRTDKVAFLDRNEAKSCGIEYQWDVLMGIASYMNDNIDFERDDWPHQSRFPGTDDKPLTNPRQIQAAEYGKNDFYVAHQ
jgi:hypothetical protein